MPVRIYEIARKLGLENKVVLSRAKELGITQAKVASSSLDKITAEYLENELAGLAPTPPPGVIVGMAATPAPAQPAAPAPKPPESAAKPVAVKQNPGQATVPTRLRTSTEAKAAAPDARGLRAVSLGNFKAFAETQRIPIRPLTLIFGANSSGKSSLIHGLLLAHHALETGELDVFKTTLGGEAVDLGGFGQYVHRRNKDVFAEFAAELDTASLSETLRSRLPEGGKVLSVEVHWGAPALDEDEAGTIPRVPQVRTCDFRLDGEPLLRFFRRRDGQFQVKEAGKAVFQRLLTGMVAFATTTPTASEEDMALAGHMFWEFLALLRFEGGGCLPGNLVTDSFTGKDLALQPISRGERTKDLVEAMRLFAPRLVSEMVRLLAVTFQGQLRRLTYLGPLRSFPPRHLAFGEARDGNWVAGGGQMWDVIKRNETVRQRVNAWLSDAQRLSTPFELTLKRHVATSQLAPLLEEAFDAIEEANPLEGDNITFRAVKASSFAVKPPDELAERAATGQISRAEYLRLLREMAVQDGTVQAADENSELSFPSMDTAKAAANTVERIHRELETIDDLELVDKRTNTLVSHRDVGIGISQVLPVLAHAYANRERLVAIEQPEIHLHPALQADLADVFIESALGEQKNTFLLETHSEHLILRILRRVRETTENHADYPAGLPKIRPEDISVVYVEPTPKGSVVRHLTVTPDGDFAEPWPGGFFAERFKDLP